MKAVQLHGYGDVDQLRYEDVATPEPGDEKILVRVIATSLNPVDWKIRQGHRQKMMPLKLPAILGRDVAGEVVKVGPNVTNWQAGQRVMGLVNGSYAEFLVTPTETLCLVPEGLSLEQAGVLPLVLLTGAQLIERAVKPHPGNTVLVTGAAGGVGRTAVFVAKQHGAHVFAGVRERQKAEAEALGADEVVAIDQDAEIDRLPVFDAIADTVSGHVIERLLPKLKPGGVLGSVLGVPDAAKGKDIRVEAFTAQPDPPRLRQLAEAVHRKEFSIPMDRKMRLSEVAQAHRLAEKGGLKGKILIVP